MPETQRAIIDTYQSIVEPPDLWVKRLPSKLDARTPKVVDLPDGGEGWSLDGGSVLLPLSNFLLVEGAVGRTVPLTDSYKTMRPGCYSPEERLKDMDVDGIDTALVFPLVGQHLQNIEDPELYKACVQAYNDSVWDWCQSGGNSRLNPVAVIPMLGGDEAGAEVRRAAGKGFKAALFTGWPNGEGPGDTEDEGFWAACEDTQVVLCVNGGPATRQNAPAAAGAKQEARLIPKTPLEVTINNMSSGNGAPQLVGRMVLRGIFDKFPRLKVCFSGVGAGWLPYFLEQVDGMYYHDRFYAGFGSKMLPSEYIRRNTRFTFHLDTSAIKNLDEIGSDYLMWCSLYPMEAGDWPKSREIIDQQLQDGDRRMILVDNAAEYFGI